MIYQFFDSYPFVYLYQHRLTTKKIPAQTICGRRFSDLSVSKTLNYPVQASAAEGFLMALNAVIENKDSNYKLVMAIHDSISLEVPETERETAAKFLKQTAETVMGEFLSPVPVFAEIKTGI